jgi:hypothetical protein
MKQPVILAPPGAGKSEFMARYPEIRELVNMCKEPAMLSLYAMMADRHGPRWWLNPDALAEKDSILRSIIPEMTFSPDAIILSAEVVFFEAADTKAVVMPPLIEHELRMSKRLNNRNNPVVYLGMDLIQLRNYYFEVAAGNLVAIYPEFTPAYWDVKNESVNKRKQEKTTV